MLPSFYPHGVVFGVPAGINIHFDLLAGWFTAHGICFVKTKQVTELNWTEVQGWAGAGGARLRTTRSHFVFSIVLHS